jgi:hypothetical protein
MSPDMARQPHAIPSREVDLADRDVTRHFLERPHGLIRHFVQTSRFEDEGPEIVPVTSARKFRELWTERMGGKPFPEEAVKHSPPISYLEQKDKPNPNKPTS